MKNKAAVLYAPHDVRLEERPMPHVGPRDVMIEVKAVGVCGCDVHYYEHGRIGSSVVRQPLILGYEAAGVIVAVGDAVSKSRIGERVAIEPGIPDGVCEQCRAGRYNLCPNVRFFGTPPIDGAFTNREWLDQRPFPVRQLLGQRVRGPSGDGHIGGGSAGNGRGADKTDVGTKVRTPRAAPL